MAIDFKVARQILLDRTKPVEIEEIPLAECAGRILAETIVAKEHVPPFDRSPYDGYAFCAADSKGASKEQPVTLQIIEEVPAGAVPTKVCAAGQAVKILTGAPLPEGADAVVMFEKTAYTKETVTIFAEVRSGENVVYAGEDVKAGTELIAAGVRMDAGCMGTIAGQGKATVKVYRRPRIGILSTGNEVMEVGADLESGKIYNSNRYTLTAAVAAYGCEPVYLGIAGDQAETVAEGLQNGLDHCDMVLSTGGVSVGDYDMTPAALELIGAETLFRGVDLKPGMACAYGEKEGKLLCGLSGNPASSLLNFYAVAVPAMKRLAGYRCCIPEEFDVALREGFRKKSSGTRLLRGVLDLSGTQTGMHVLDGQGNIMLNSLIGCDMLAIVPAGTGAIEPGTVLKGFLL